MGVAITRIDATFSKVLLEPSIDGSKRLTINDKVNITRIRMIDNPDTADMVKIYMVDGEVLELHYQVHYPEHLADGSIDWGVTVGGVKATSNEELHDLLDDLIKAV